MHICRIATVPFFFQHHLREQIVATVAQGHRVTLIFGPGRELGDLLPIEGCLFKEIELPRNISLRADVKALWRLYWHFRRAKYDIVHSTTPKAELLSAVSSFLARIPIRIHTFTGQPWMEKKGLIRVVARLADRITAFLSTRVYADSPTQSAFLVSEGICNPNKIFVLGSGSLAGVNLSRFNVGYRDQKGPVVRQDLKIENDETILTFIGRITAEKGVEELITAFDMINPEKNRCVLLLVGPEDTEHGGLSRTIKQKIETNKKIKLVGYTNEPEKYLAATDIFCLPSHREGFGNVVLEAAAMAVPTVGSDIIGLRDAILHGETGVLVPPKNAEALANAFDNLLTHPDWRAQLGKNALDRAVRDFDSKRINNFMLLEYDQMYNQSLSLRD